MSARLFLIVFAVMLITMTAQAQDFVTNGLIAMWTMDKGDVSGNTVKDVSGNGNDATVMGTVSFGAGVINEAAVFTAAPNSYIEIPDMGEMEQDSVECWAYETAFSGIQGIVSTWQWAAGKVHFKFESSQIQVDKNGVGKISQNAQAKTWYHIIYTQGVNDGTKLYVDGVLAGQLPSAGAAPENWHERRIGSEHDGRFLNGMIDEVRVYNRILSEAEVVKNFNAKSNQLTAVEPTSKLTTTWSRIKQDALIR